MRLIKILLTLVEVLLFVILVGVVGGLWWLKHYVQSPAFSQQVQTQISQATGTTAAFDRLGFELSKGIVVDKFTLTNPQDAREPNLFSVGKIQLNYELSSLWKSLLQQKPEFSQLLILQPAVRLRQKEDGSFPIPIPPASDTNPSTASSPANADSGFPFILHVFSLENGSISVRGADNSVKLQVDGLDAKATLPGTPGDPPVSGIIKINQAVVAGGITVTSIQSPFAVADDKLSLSGIDATAYQGHLSGSLDQSLSKPEYAYNLKLSGDSIDINILLTELANKPQVMSGKLTIKSAWLGPATDPLKISGNGSVEIKSGQLIAVPLLRTIAGILSLKQLSQPDFSEIKTDFSLADQVVTLINLSLKSTLFDLTGGGTVGFNQQLNLQLKLGLSPDLYKQLPLSMGDRMSLREDGFRTVSFTVTGTVSDPKTDLIQQLVGVEAILKDPNSVQDLKNSFNRFLGKPDKQPSPTPFPTGPYTPQAPQPSVAPTPSAPTLPSSPVPLEPTPLPIPPSTGVTPSPVPTS